MFKCSCHHNQAVVADVDIVDVADVDVVSLDYLRGTLFSTPPTDGCSTPPTAGCSTPPTAVCTTSPTAR